MDQLRLSLLPSPCRTKTQQITVSIFFYKVFLLFSMLFFVSYKKERVVRALQEVEISPIYFTFSIYFFSSILLSVVAETIFLCLYSNCIRCYLNYIHIFWVSYERHTKNRGIVWTSWNISGSDGKEMQPTKSRQSSTRASAYLLTYQ